MVGGQCILCITEHFLVKLLSRTQSSISYLDVLTGYETGEFYHTLGQMGYLHTGSHVEDEDLIAGTHGGGFHYQTTGFGDGHEETGDVTMGDSDRSSLGNLVTEAGNDATITAKHIAEAGGDKFGDGLAALDAQTFRTALQRQTE